MHHPQEHRRAPRLPTQLAWVGMLALATGTSAAQSLTGAPAPSPTPAAAYATAPIVLDGQTLFTVAAATNAPGQLPVATRASDITSVISQIVDTTSGGTPAYDPRTLRVTVHDEGAGEVLEVTDARHPTPLPVVTVTSVDATAQQTNPATLAGQWQETLQGALVHAILIREPRVQQRHVLQAAIAAVVLLLLTFGAIALSRRMARRIGELAKAADRQRDALETIQQSAQHPPARAEHQRRQARAVLLGTLKPAQRVGALRAARGLLVWGMLLVWCLGAAWVALLFPQTTPLGHELGRNILVVVGIVVITGLIDRILSLAIGRLPSLWDLHAFSPVDGERRSLRMPTIVRALDGFKTFLLVFVAILTALAQIGIPVGSVVTIGGVAAIAVSLAAQNLLRDVVSGFLVLTEDQFVLGDFVTINGASGIVEQLTLRMVQLRDGSGSVVTISHSAASLVVNHSRNWSRVDYAVAIDPAADAAAAIEIVRRTVEELGKDQAWRSEIEGPLEWIGVDGLSRDGIVIRCRLRTAPLQQFALHRELNLRVSQAFREAKIGYGAPVPTVTPSS